MLVLMVMVQLLDHHTVSTSPLFYHLSSTHLLFRRPIAHHFPYASAAFTHLQNVSVLEKVPSIKNITYFLSFDGIIGPVDACQGLSIPSKLIVAGVGVDDGRAVIGSGGFHCAGWVSLCCCASEQENRGHQRDVHLESVRTIEWCGTPI
jgi:hypothetical protein